MTLTMSEKGYAFIGPAIAFQPLNLSGVETQQVRMYPTTELGIEESVDGGARYVREETDAFVIPAQSYQICDLDQIAGIEMLASLWIEEAMDRPTRLWRVPRGALTIPSWQRAKRCELHRICCP